MRALICSFLVLHLVAAASARSWTDDDKVYTFNLPEGWEQPGSGMIRSPERTEKVELNPVPDNVNLERMIKIATRNHDHVDVTRFTVGGQPAVRVQYTDSSGDLITKFLSWKKGKGINLLLLQRSDQPGDPKALQDQIQSSLRWR